MGTQDDDLRYLYHLHDPNAFTRGIGVTVTGAGSKEVNGFYRFRDPSEGPPTFSMGRTTFQYVSSYVTRDQWRRRPLYVKDKGCKMYISVHPSMEAIQPYTPYVPRRWFCRSRTGRYYYMTRASTADQPPTRGWFTTMPAKATTVGQ